MKYFLYKYLLNKKVFCGLIVLIICFALTALIYKNSGLYSRHKNNDTVTKIIMKWQGRELYLPICDSVSAELFQKQTKALKIITFIDGNCGVCVSDLDKWKPIILQLRTLSNVSFVFYVHAMDFDRLVSYISEEEPFPIPLINDSDNSFFIKNSLEQNKMIQTFLVDSNNRIMLIGNPILNEKVYSLYMETIMNQEKYRL